MNIMNINKTENRIILLYSKLRLDLQLLTPGMMKLLEITEKKSIKIKMLTCIKFSNVVSENYQQNSKIMYKSILNK